MSAADLPLHPLAYVALGDLVSLPDGRRLSVRARVSLPVPEGPMAGFLICGELEALLSLPSQQHAPVGVYIPIPYLPQSAADAKVVFEGVTSYWAPHLPSVAGAMGELAWRVLRVRNAFDPLVAVYRGNELVVFVKASEAALEDLSVRFMPRTGDDDATVARHSALVGAPAPAPVPQRSLADATRRR
jgi:hypothetical protein